MSDPCGFNGSDNKENLGKVGVLALEQVSLRGRRKGTFQDRIQWLDHQHPGPVYNLSVFSKHILKVILAHKQCFLMRYFRDIILYKTPESMLAMSDPLQKTTQTEVEAGWW